MNVRVNTADAAKKTLHVSADRSVFGRMGKVGLQLIFLYDNARRSSFDEKIGQGIEGRRIGAQRNLQPRRRHDFSMP